MPCQLRALDKFSRVYVLPLSSIYTRSCGRAEIELNRLYLVRHDEGTTCKLMLTIYAWKAWKEHVLACCKTRHQSDPGRFKFMKEESVVINFYSFFSSKSHDSMIGLRSNGNQAFYARFPLAIRS